MLLFIWNSTIKGSAEGSWKVVSPLFPLILTVIDLKLIKNVCERPNKGALPCYISYYRRWKILQPHWNSYCDMANWCATLNICIFSKLFSWKILPRCRNSRKKFRIQTKITNIFVECTLVYFPSDYYLARLNSRWNKYCRVKLYRFVDFSNYLMNNRCFKAKQNCMLHVGGWLWMNHER